MEYPFLGKHESTRYLMKGCLSLTASLILIPAGSCLKDYGILHSGSIFLFIFAFYFFVRYIQVRKDKHLT